MKRNGDQGIEIKELKAAEKGTRGNKEKGQKEC